MNSTPSKRGAAWRGFHLTIKTALLATLIVILTNQFAIGGSATWKVDPISNDWNTAENWMPATVPNGPDDVATFDVSNQTAITVSANTEVANIVFDPGASIFTITSGPAVELTVSGVGVANNSGVEQNFVVTTDASGGGALSFTNEATAGDQVSYTVNGSSGAAAGLLSFHDTSTAGTASFVTNSSSVFIGLWATLEFDDNSTAGDAVIVSNPGASTYLVGGRTYFYNASNAGNATVTNKGDTAAGGSNGTTIFDDTATAGSATFVNEGAAVNGANLAGITYFDGNSTAGDATFIINREQGGRNGEPAAVIFEEDSSAGNATFRAYGGANPYFGGYIQFLGTSNGGSSRIALLGSNTSLIPTGV